MSRRGRPNPVIEGPLLWWLLAGSALAVGGGVTYAVVQKNKQAASAAPAPSSSSGATMPPLGSKSNPIRLGPTELYGPKGAWAVRTVGGMDQLGQFLTPITVLGTTEYAFVKLSETPSAALIAQENAAAQAAANAASQNAAAAAMNVAAKTPTPLPQGSFTYSLDLEADKTVQIQLNPGNTVALSFPNSACANWTSAISSAAVTVNPPNVLIAAQPGSAQVTFSCAVTGTRTTVNVNVVPPSEGVTLQG